MLDGIPDWALVVTVVVVPLAVVMIVGMFKGYDISLLFKRRDDDKDR
jgi:Tfp pilus assembly protein PilO